LSDGSSLIVGPGKHLIGQAISAPAISIADFNGEITSVQNQTDSVELSYIARSRAVLVLSSPVSAVEVDGESIPVALNLLLPAGKHVVKLTR
jgi:hypothetical protein